MGYEINYENGISNRGNLTRIKSVMKRAMAGEKIVLGFLGGSITHGSLATKPTLCYAYHVYEWWKSAFPQAEFVYVNGGIGGTTSQFGVARVEDDILKYDPDFVIIEFSVNDDSNAHFLETYEGLVRKVYSFKKKPAVMLVHNVYYHNGGNAQIEHAKVARHYDLPAVSMQSSIYPEVVCGKIPNRAITPDDLHPNDTGHALVASVITYALEKIKKEADVAEETEKTYPLPLTENGYENSVRYQNYNCAPVCAGFIKDEAPQKEIADCFKNGWFAKEAGDSIEFEMEGCGISVQYKKSVKQPAPVAKVVVDGKEEDTCLLDANFDETWGDKLELDTITEHTPFGKHHVKITILDSKKKAVVPFYLVSVIAAK